MRSYSARFVKKLVRAHLWVFLFNEIVSVGFTDLKSSCLKLLQNVCTTVLIE